MNTQTKQSMKDPLQKICDESSLTDWTVTKDPRESYVSHARYLIWTPSGEDFAHAFTEKNAMLILDAMSKMFPPEHRAIGLPDARLIAAAPAMLQALKSIIAVLDGRQPKDIPGAIMAAEYAIQKATGEA